MKTSTIFPQLPTILSFALFISFGLSGCASTYYSNVGQRASEEFIIPAETAAHSQQWQTNDLKINYDIRNTQESFTVSGTVSMNKFITHSFPAAERFRLFINYLDRNGTALSTADISPLIGYRRDVPEKMKLRNVPLAPPEASAFTFSYIGTFTGGNNADENSGDWEVYFTPFNNGM